MIRHAPGLTVVIAALTLIGCEESARAEGARSLDEIKESGELIVLTRNAPTTWYIGRHGQPAGPEHDLVESFAGSLGVETTYREKPTVSAVLKAVDNGEGDLAAAGLTITEARRERFTFGPAYQNITQQVVCRRGRAAPESVDDLVGLDLAVIADSSYAERLAELKANGHPELAWQEVEDTTTELLIRRVWQGELDCTVADSSIVDINRRYYPELIAPVNLTREQQLGWAMPAGSRALAGAVKQWLKAFRADGRLETWHERYYGFFHEFNYVDTAALIRRVDERFPKYRGYFRQAAEQYDLPYTLIAAQGYQESHWDPLATSPTGVRGIMMLTLITAREVGVTDRLDPKQSIFGGAKYMAGMKQRFVDEVEEPDRTYLALAAYNVGRAHVHDAQKLARQRDLSPHLWRDIKQVLPLLAKPEVYRNLKYGYARGWEPVRYVQRIREYRHTLENRLEDD